MVPTRWCSGKLLSKCSKLPQSGFSRKMDWKRSSSLMPFPLRSPDLSAMNFFLWGYLKSKIYWIPFQNLVELKESIRKYKNEIPTMVPVKVQYECIRRMVLCMQQDGKHFGFNINFIIINIRFYRICFFIADDIFTRIIRVRSCSLVKRKD